MTIRFQYSATENARAFSEIPERRAIFKYWYPISVGSMALIFVLQGVRRPYESFGDFMILFALMSPVTASFILLPYFVRRSILSRFRRGSADRSDLAEIRSFGPEGFVSAPAWSDPVPWNFITKVAESEQFVFIYHSGSQQPEYVPKAAMTDAEMGELRSILRNRLGNESAQLKLYPSAR